MASGNEQVKRLVEHCNKLYASVQVEIVNKPNLDEVINQTQTLFPGIHIFAVYPFEYINDGKRYLTRSAKLDRIKLYAEFGRACLIIVVLDEDVEMIEC